MYSIIDIEGSGGQFGEEKIIEIAIYKFDGKEIIDQFSTLVNPEKEIDDYVQKLTRITDKMVKRAPKFFSIAKRIIEITEGTTLVAHNSDFDYRMLRQEFNELGYQFEMQTLDTVKLSEYILPDQKSYSLSKITKSLGISHLDKHRAFGDARATLELFKILLAKDTEKNIIEKAISQKLYRRFSPQLIEMLEELPHTTGVFYVHNVHGKIIFVGWALDISNRVHQYFTTTELLGVKIQNKADRISFEETGSALLAKIKCFEEERKLKPKLNKPHLKKKKKLPKNPLFPADTIWIDKGRNANESSYFVVENGFLKGYGYFELNAQIDSKEKWKQRMIPIQETMEMRSSFQEWLDKRKAKVE